MKQKIDYKKLWLEWVPIGICAVAHYSVHIIFFDEVFDFFLVLVDDGDSMSLAGQVFQDGPADRAKSNDDDFHNLHIQSVCVSFWLLCGKMLCFIIAQYFKKSIPFKDFFAYTLAFILILSVFRCRWMIFRSFFRAHRAIPRSRAP